ncbi:MAG: DEAD/DEAH box helicase family protein, partial [Anaerolineales bacterium]|nr:DEAD/DEAH box helicase family protein [Anaerolineales bacterium]
MPSIVTIDLETTGLDPRHDTIIEIGAVRFNSRRVEDEWTTLINPGRPIPPFISKLTGITNAMVRNAPTLQEIYDKFEHFVEDLPILGHNVPFDRSFLQKNGLFQYNDYLDTYALASVLMPNAGRYNLGALAQQLNVLLPATHRALDDARVTHAVYTRLFDKAMELPIDLLAEIVRMGETMDWGGGWIFSEALKMRAREPARARQAGHTISGPLFDAPRTKEVEPVTPVRDPLPLDEEEVAAYLEYGGAFADYFPEFEHRPQQVEMLRAVTVALSEGRHLLAEAGTGTGKSIAYLVPAALFAIQNNTRVVISTNTINLQDQLINKDIPDLQAVLGTELRATVLKGRSNYLCPRRLEAMRRRGPESPTEMRVLAKMLIWLESSESGDLSDVNITGPAERAVWARLSSADEGCSTETCVRRMGGICPFYRARQSAQNAHIIIVNHALLLADVATGNRVLPEYQYLIVDEAHHIEAATTSALSFRVTQPEIERMLRELGGTNSGILGRTLSAASDLLDPGQMAALNHLIEQATDKAFHFQNLIGKFFTALNDFLTDQREGRQLGTYAHQERILPGTRTLPAWLNVEVAWEEAHRSLEPMLGILENVAQALAELAESGEEDIEDLLSEVGTNYRHFAELNENVEALVFEPAD